MGSNRVSEIRVNENSVRIWARVTKFRVRANFRVSMLRVRLRLRTSHVDRWIGLGLGLKCRVTTLNHKSQSHVERQIGNV